MDEQVDAIVVGGGHNGLICAAYLARAGLATTVVEARTEVGGCASTVDAIGARVNICNCDHIAFRTTPIAEELELAAHGLEYIDVEPGSLALNWSGANPWYIFSDLERTLESLSLTHPGEVDNYRRYHRAALPVARLILEMSQGTPTPGRAARSALRSRGRGVATLLRWSRRSAAQVLRSFFDTEEVMAPVVHSGPAVWGISPESPGSGLGAVGYALKSLHGVGRPRGGSGMVPATTAAALLAAGGEIRTSSPVQRVLVEGDRIRGVVLGDGTELEAGVVVVACDPRDLFVEWVGGGIPALADLHRKWLDRPVREGYESKIDAVIGELPVLRDTARARPGELGVDPLWGPTVLVSPDLAGMDRAHRLIGTGEVAERPLVFANIASALDPTLRVGGPTGDHVLSLEVLFTPYSLKEGWKATREPQRWLELFADICEPGFLESVRRWRVMTPPDYEEQFNLHRGHAPAFAGGPVAALRGVDPELSRYETPVEGLFLTGAATFPGAGVWGASGRNAAAVVLAGQGLNLNP